MSLFLNHSIKSIFKTTLACVVGLTPICAIAASDINKDNPQDAFFQQLKQHCGKSYTGTSVFPADPGSDFKGKVLTMTIASCTDNELRIPFYVGSNTSRTWILTKTKKGLLFKHDHRHDDGTPDEVTNYGGYADSKGSDNEQHFPADAFTAKLIPKAATNVWTMRFEQQGKRFVYHLKRDGKDRYTAHFDLGL